MFRNASAPRGLLQRSLELSEEHFPAVGLEEPPCVPQLWGPAGLLDPLLPSPWGEGAGGCPLSCGGADKSSEPEQRLLFVPVSQRRMAVGMNAASSHISSTVGTDGVRVERSCGNVSLLWGLSGSSWLLPKPLLAVGREGSCSEIGQENVPVLFCQLRSPSALHPPAPSVGTCGSG